MTTEEIALVIVGAIVNAGTFAAGVLMGVSLHRKDAKNECDSDEKEVEINRLRYHDSLR